MDEVIQLDPMAALGQHIAGALGAAVTGSEIAFGELTITVGRDAIVSVASFLRDDPRCRFISLIDICGVDYPERDERFEVVYMLLSLDYGFDGHPLRKDFPLTGFVEVRYDEERKRVVYEPVKLAQEFRSFDYLSPWEGTDYVLPGDEKAKQ